MIAEPEVLFADGFGDAFLGLAFVWHPDGSRIQRAVYSVDKIVSVLMGRDGCSYDEAVEFVEFNVEGAYVGERTPIFVWDSEWTREMVDHP